VKCCAEIQVCPKSLKKPLPKLGSELRIYIKYNCLNHTMYPRNFLYINLFNNGFLVSHLDWNKICSHCNLANQYMHINRVRRRVHWLQNKILHKIQATIEYIRIHEWRKHYEAEEMDTELQVRRVRREGARTSEVWKKYIQIMANPLVNFKLEKIWFKVEKECSRLISAFVNELLRHIEIIW